MSKDTIYRQAAIDKFEPWLKIEGYSEGERNMLKAVLYELRFLPSAQPKRKTGKWIYQSGLGWGETWICSECGEKTTSTIMGKPRYEWCPMCGADMRGMRGEQDGADKE